MFNLNRKSEDYESSKLMRKVTNKIQEQLTKEKKYIPHSLAHTKIELPILYSNLIIIEDMKFENSNYFFNANGFLSSSINV
jgi:hypothetical protein